jgi:hypothetical protein
MRTTGTKVAVMKPFELEADLYDATHMAHIAATLIDSALGSRSVQKELTGKPNTYYIDDQDADAMIYAVSEVHNMIRNLRDRYLRGQAT